MQFVRPAFAMEPKHFGKARVRDFTGVRPIPSSIRDDLRLFATTFVAGFVVVSVLIG
jgi:hypothetical protein